jgi:hypothetical protein
MYKFITGPDQGNVTLFLVFAFVAALLGLFGAGPSHSSTPIPTEDVEFTRCTCDSAIYCLTDEQYTVIMAQLAGRLEP